MLKFSLIRAKAPSHQPTRVQIAKWLRASLCDKYATVILTISIVDQASAQELNQQYRGIDKATNVISLEYPGSRDEFNILSGELILCDAVIVAEAQQQAKPVLAHYAHLLVHGMLHLQGYDHLIESAAEEMEALEAVILATLGFSNPYEV